eukprot:TRINITY_DN68064_c0_g1_i1.p1 TRINITY_DN68064_c0_g1~~TRINITY_DN68064_c0_g1_i1.p1  ORF type:complete len:183 (+),score=43.64 TRINITY_DN68064_c0_g1_i1:84-632(+)
MEEVAARLPFSVEAYGARSLETEEVDIGRYATWSVSSAKHGNGVTQLCDGSKDTYWQSDGVQPHLVDLQWNRPMRVMRVDVLFDFQSDESYTPKRISIRAGSTYHDLQDLGTHELNEPQGWVSFPLSSDSANVAYASLVQMAIHENHQNGRDTHVRQVKVFGPSLRTDRYSSTSLSDAIVLR